MPTKTRLRSPLSRQFRSATQRLDQIRAEPNRFSGQRDGAYANLLIGLASETLTTHAHAIRAYRERSLPYLAWATRGLFELLLWSEYCTHSPANARGFVQDTVRDHVGLIEALGIAERALPGSETAAGFDDLTRLLVRVSSDVGMDRLDSKYTRLSKAVREIGVFQTYQRVNTVLSKFVHPTALVANSPVVDEMVNLFSEKFIQISDVCASGVFAIVAKEQKKIRKKRPLRTLGTPPAAGRRPSN